MSASAAFDPRDLDPGGDWRCDSCGGLVEAFGVYVCSACVFPNRQEADR